MTERERLIDFLQDLKDEINTGRSRNDLKTLINQEIKSINRGENETQAVRPNEQLEEFIKKIQEQTIDLDPEIAQVVSNHLWNLL